MVNPVEQDLRHTPDEKMRGEVPVGKASVSTSKKIKYRRSSSLNKLINLWQRKTVTVKHPLGPQKETV